jgi:hypothetical protein
MTGTSLDYSKHCKVPFGAYVETHEENSPTNTMSERTRGAVCLGPSANFQGSYKLLCLRTGRKIVRKQFTELPMPDSVIKRVEAISARDKRSGNMVFSARDGTTIGDDRDDDDDEDVTAGLDNGENDDTGEERSQKKPPGIPLENQNGPSSDEINNEEAELILTPEFTADTPETDEEEIPGVGGARPQEWGRTRSQEWVRVTKNRPPASTPMTLMMVMMTSQVLRPVMIRTAVTTRMMMTSLDHKCITQTPGHRPSSEFTVFGPGKSVTTVICMQISCITP